MRFISIHFRQILLLHLLVFIGFLFFIVACSNSRKYPCPAYSRPNMQFDSTGNMIGGGYKTRKDSKSGLLNKKKNAKLMDRRRAG